MNVSNGHKLVKNRWLHSLCTGEAYELYNSMQLEKSSRLSWIPKAKQIFSLRKWKYQYFKYFTLAPCIKLFWHYRWTKSSKKTNCKTCSPLTNFLSLTLFSLVNMQHLSAEPLICNWKFSYQNPNGGKQTTWHANLEAELTWSFKGLDTSEKRRGIDEAYFINQSAWMHVSNVTLESDRQVKWPTELVSASKEAH